MSGMDNNTPRGATHLERAEQLAKWLAEYMESPGGLVGKVDTRGYVFAEGWNLRRQAS